MQQSVVDAIREATSERPWLWVVIVLVIVLPIVLIVVYCCRSSGGSDKTSELERRARELHKKDDDIVEEDDEEEEDKLEAGDSVQDESNPDETVADAARNESVSGGARGDETPTMTTKADLESDSDNDSPSKVRLAL